MTVNKALWSIALVCLAALLLFGPGLALADQGAPEETHAEAAITSHDSHGSDAHATEWDPPVWSVIGFALMLLCIAIIPLVAEHWWESNLNKGIIAVALAIPVGIYVIMNDWHALDHELREYFAFIVLLGTLFVISGGIFLHGHIQAKP